MGRGPHHDGALRTPDRPPVSPFAAGLRCRCPRCGEGRLYGGLLALRPGCAVCGLDLVAHDSGDGAAAFVILILGALVVGLAIAVEVGYEPPLWLHIAIWPVVILAGAIAIMRPVKATLIALNYRHRRGLGDEP